MDNTLQKTIIKELGVKPIINSTQEIRRRIDFLKSYALNSGAKGFVLGISGGQDSTLAGKLAQMAVNELNAETEGRPYVFLAVRLPYGTQSDENDAQLAITFIEPTETVLFNIKKAVDNVADEYGEYSWDEHKHLSDFHKGNVKARMRMIAQYAYAGERNLLVIGTDHAAEAVTGFFTKFGDGGADILPLAGLNKRQGKDLLKKLGAPEKLYRKTPTADLLDGNRNQPDEFELGISYDEIDDYLEGKMVTDEARETIERRFLMSVHKRTLPASATDFGG